MTRTLIPAGLALVGALGTWQLIELRNRANDLERAPRADPTEVSRLERELAAVRGELESTRYALANDRAKSEFAERLYHLEARVSENDCRLEDQGSRLSSWEGLWLGLRPELDGRIQSLEVGLEARWRALDDQVGATEQVAREDRERLERLNEALVKSRDKVAMWDDLMGPVVQLAGETTVGSGVLLQSRPSGGEGKYKTHLLTAWHVVRDIYGSPDNTDRPVPVKMYLENGGTQSETAHLLAHDVRLDVALLVLDTSERMPCGARLASRERLRDVKIFDPVYAVGCPLGNDPIPTAGEVAATQHEVEGCTYWMISAPTYIGNSGGGIFDAETHELLAIFSKIYTHGSLRSTIVPHMGLSTPLTKVYEWLDQTEFADVEPPASAGEPQMAAAKREQ